MWAGCHCRGRQTDWKLRAALATSHCDGRLRVRTDRKFIFRQATGTGHPTCRGTSSSGCPRKKTLVDALARGQAPLQTSPPSQGGARASHPLVLVVSCWKAQRGHACMALTHHSHRWVMENTTRPMTAPPRTPGRWRRTAPQKGLPRHLVWVPLAVLRLSWNLHVASSLRARTGFRPSLWAAFPNDLPTGAGA